MLWAAARPWTSWSARTSRRAWTGWTCRPGRAEGRHADDRPAVRQGPRHRERLRPAARPRRHRARVLAAGAWSRALCDRRGGLGADGVIRVVRTDASDDPAAVAARGEAEWFMDYRNADGSVSEMCGNGVRVLRAATWSATRASTPRGRSPVATRAGTKVLTFEPGGQVTVDMGRARCSARPRWPSPGHRSGRPRHRPGQPARRRVRRPPRRRPAALRRAARARRADLFPTGVNVEFVARRGPRHVAMRVHERGSGETRSCGTGACAVMVASGAWPTGSVAGCVVRRRRARGDAADHLDRGRPRC